jgi:thiol:disulfide interchange protein DsbA
MKRRIAWPVFLALIITSLAQAQTWTEGTHYFAIVPAQSTTVPAGKIEVAEVFSYGCPFCAKMDPLIQQFRKTLPPSAQMVFVPASFIPSEDWPMFQRAALTAQALGIFDSTHAKVFDAVWTTGELAISDPQTHRLRNPLPSIEDAARYYNHISGVPVDKFLDTARSFAVDMQMRRTDSFILACHVDSTPTLIVNGKYRITGQSAGGLPQMLEIAKWLVAREAAASQPKR